MRKFAGAMLTVLLTFPAGCGLFYQAASGYRANQMEKILKPGMTSLEVHQTWGEPDIRNYVDRAHRDLELCQTRQQRRCDGGRPYTSAKQGDKGSFLDLKFDDGKLVSWNEATHTMPAKEGSGFSAGIGGASQGGTVHY